MSFDHPIWSQVRGASPQTTPAHGVEDDGALEVIGESFPTHRLCDHHPGSHEGTDQFFERKR